MPQCLGAAHRYEARITVLLSQINQTANVSRGRGRPADTEKRAAVLRHARKQLFALGPHVARLDDIARDAGVSKMTIYNMFGNKDQLFDAVVNEICDEMENALTRSVPSDAPLEEALGAFGRHLTRQLMSDDFLWLDYVLAASEATDASAKADFFEKGPGRVLQTLATYLAQRVERGELKIDDCLQAAEELTVLWQGQWPMRRRYGVVEKLTEAELERRVSRGVRIFKAAYDPKTGAF
ncbi:TetR/AcrR family transcriptional regulator [Thalassococcus sp. S3]|uniref:TetR/AcrR family transcriptional regulator n=1 Tax=Thalassococcus sp. S3 TaxID=2017482 RepID=UPI0010247DC4|nr:TetR/AcrR family transcriptional regulator [Thalassococcus sp. S3]QBF33370.1 hypothetical protein CFI11_19430 [Thalassococcus sp. S3]